MSCQLSALEKLSYFYHVCLKKDTGFWNWLADQQCEPTEEGLRSLYVRVQRDYKSNKN